jgi:AcrR family transcriptional regulator
MFTKNVNPPGRRGRPPGPTAAGEQTRRRLFDAAIERIAAVGYEPATLRDIARDAGVSPGLLYRYFPSKRAVVLALYDELSADYAAKAQGMSPGRWRDRFLFALETSLAVLRPHRRALQALIPTIVASTEEGVFAATTAFSRERVQGVFMSAVRDASDVPGAKLAGALGRLLYLAHLAVILCWLLDKSRDQRATRGLVALTGRTLPALAVALKLPMVRGLVASADELFGEAL